MRRFVLLLIGLAAGVFGLHGQVAGGVGAYEPALQGLVAPRPVGFGYYDVDRIYDTVPALFYNDGDYTPDGRYRWNSERYACKIRNTAAVVDSMALPFVALWGVENEAVVRDLVSASAGDYSYLHRTLNALDGLDFALLYYGDRFFPDFVEDGRRYLYVEGLMDDERVGMLLVADARMARWVIGDLRETRRGVKLLVAGRSEGVDAAAFGLRDAQSAALRAGRGTVRSRGRWRMRDRILVDTAFCLRRGDVYARRFLIDGQSGAPFATFSRGLYRGGYSYSLPVFVYFEMP